MATLLDKMGQTIFHLPAEARRVLILVNPRAGRRGEARRVERLATSLRQRGLEVDVTDNLGEACPRAGHLHEQGELRALVGVGGDGTAAELVNRTPPGLPITLLPAGTANLLAKQLGLPSDPEDAAAAITAGLCRRIDAACAAGRIFLLMASCGFDAEVVRQVHAVRQSAGHKGHISYASYLKPIWRSIRNYEYPQIRVYCDEPAVEPVAARWVFVCNLSRYGWGLNLTPQAEHDDGLLDVCTFRRGSLWHGLRYLAAVQLGAWHGRLSDCTIRQARRIRITSDQPVAYQLDGDPGGQLPLEIELLPERVTLLVPLTGP